MRCHASITALALLLCSSALLGCKGDDPEESAPGEDSQAWVWGTPIYAGGSFSCDFSLPGGVPLNEVPPLIERDRMYMADRPGMQHKHLPLAFDNATGNLFSGGRYLFDTAAQAQDYKEWVENDFILDGTLFLERPIFIQPECHAWSVIGAHKFASIETSQVVVRTERGTLSNNVSKYDLLNYWPTLRQQARERGLSAIWFMYNPQEDLAQVVYFGARVGTPDPTTPDFASLNALASAPSFSSTVSSSDWTPTFDRTQWVLTVWYPFEAGDQGQPSLWQHSPPFPQPYCGDTVCEVSRGETGVACPADCQPGCGNATCNAGENTQNCPGDCRI